MRQETGSNPNSASKKVSIQVKLGGHSFSTDKIVVAEDVEIPAEPEVEGESNPNTGAPVGFFGWLFSLIFG